MISIHYQILLETIDVDYVYCLEIMMMKDSNHWVFSENSKTIECDRCDGIYSSVEDVIYSIVQLAVELNKVE
jgi:hypothetical protein